MHRVYIWTKRLLNICFRAITASSECEGRDKQPNFKADQTQAQDSTPAKSWLRCALNTAALNTAQRIDTDTQAYLQGLSAHRQRPLGTQAKASRHAGPWTQAYLQGLSARRSMDTGKSLYNIYTSWTLKLSWKIISKSTLYQFPNLGVHIRSKTSSNLPNLTKCVYFMSIEN